MNFPTMGQIAHKESKMDIMDGLAGTLAGMQEDAPKVAKMGGGVLLGIALGSIVSNFINDLGVTTKEDGSKVVTKDGKETPLPASLEEQDKLRPVPHWVGPAAVIAVGLGLFAAKRGDYPVLAGANGLGMVAYGAGRLAKNFLNRAAAKEPKGTAAMINSYIPFGATDTYESPLLAGLGYGMGPGSIDRYLSAGVSGFGYGDYDRSPGAPTFVETVPSFASAPTQFQEVRPLAAAPMTINGLNGLSATLM